MIERIKKIDDGIATLIPDLPDIYDRKENAMRKLSQKITLCIFNKRIYGDFMSMQDVLLDEEFVLYSPSISNIVAEKGEMELFYFLRMFNEDCWETYGSVQYYKGFFLKDFICFATVDKLTKKMGAK